MTTPYKPRVRKPYLSAKVVAAIPRVLDRFTAADMAADPQLAAVLNYLAEWEHYTNRPDVKARREKLAAATEVAKAKVRTHPAPKRGDVHVWQGKEYTRLTDLARAMFPAEPTSRTLTRLRDNIQRGLTLEQIAAKYTRSTTK